MRAHVLILLMVYGAVMSLAACAKVQVAEAGRPCDDGECLAGYRCHPRTQLCVQELRQGCDGSGLCPAEIVTGSACATPGTLLDCTNAGEACRFGCRECLPSGLWSDCALAADGSSKGCDLATLNACAHCDNDCAVQVLHADARCDVTQAAAHCVYGTCADGYRDLDGVAANGCEAPPACVPQCTGKCGGDDGCSGTCPDTCVPPQSCGGGTVPSVCGCTPWCGERCAGSDGCGGVCGGSCTWPETCGGGGSAEVCGWWWSCDYRYRKTLTLTLNEGESLAAGWPIAITLNHAAYVSLGEALASGNDFRLVTFDATYGWTELSRVADPLAPFNSTATTLWFALAAPLRAAASEVSYFLYYGHPGAGAPPADESAIFPFADFFERPDSVTVGGGWVEYDVDTGYAGRAVIQDGALVYTQTGESLFNRPLVQRNLVWPSGIVELRLGLDFTAPVGDDRYSAAFQLGDRDLMTEVPDTVENSTHDVGVGVNINWWGNTSLDPPRYEQLWCAKDGYVYGVPSDPVSGPVDVRALIDLSTQFYRVSVDGVVMCDGIDFEDPVTALNRIRFFTRRLADTGSHRAINYVWVRPVSLVSPTINLGEESQHSCP